MQSYMSKSYTYFTDNQNDIIYDVIKFWILSDCSDADKFNALTLISKNETSNIFPFSNYYYSQLFFKCTKSIAV